ncbi:MAG TPA: DUF3782 domain-containing protein [Pyrodictium sp.]|nr:DUF3782 domain-containing protein [Pyrodictium sp.]
MAVGFDKEAFLRALEEDSEFRYAVMGLLGFREILERIVKLEERLVRLEERFARLEEEFKKLYERQLKLEERQQKLEERFAELERRFLELEKRFAELAERQQKLEERLARLEERFVRLEERFARLEERQQKLEERQQRLEEELRNTRRVVIAIAHRFGVISEKAFRHAMRYVVEEVFGVARVEKWVYRDREGFVYGYPSIVEVDLIVRDKEHILVEVKSRVSKADIAELYRIGKLYEKVEGVKPRLAIIGGLVDPEVHEVAARLGIRIIPVAEE